MMARGEKTIEGRAPDAASRPTQTEMGKNYKLMNQFDQIRIQLVDENYKRVFTMPPLFFTAFSVTGYDSIEDALRKVDFKKLMPDAKSGADVLQKYFSFPGYQERVRKSGFVVVELRKLFP
jgi:ASC-1-like (ASCH) protein